MSVFREHADRRRCSRRACYVGESVERLGLLRRQRGGHQEPPRRDGRDRRSAVRAQLDLRDLRRTDGGSIVRSRDAVSGQPARRDQAPVREVLRDYHRANADPVGGDCATWKKQKPPIAAGRFSRIADGDPPDRVSVKGRRSADETRATVFGDATDARPPADAAMGHPRRGCGRWRASSLSKRWNAATRRDHGLQPRPALALGRWCSRRRGPSPRSAARSGAEATWRVGFR